MNNRSIPSTQAERKITIRSHKHSFTPYPSLSPYWQTESWTEKQIHSLCVGWRNFRTGVSCFSKTLFYFILLALTRGRVTCCWHPKEFGYPFSVGGLSNEGAIVHIPCWLRITLTTNRQVPKWFCSRGCCAHWVINFCGAPLSNKPPWLLPLSSAILLGNCTTPLAGPHRARPDIIKPACHRPTCRYSIIKRTCLGCRRLISRYVLWQLIVFAVAMVVVVKADCQSFAAVDIVVIAATVVAVYFFQLPSWGGWWQPPSMPLQGG